MKTQRIAVRVLNGRDGSVREVVANVKALSESAAVEALFTRARRDDYYYRFLGRSGVLEPSDGTPIEYQGAIYFAR